MNLSDLITRLQQQQMFQDGDNREVIIRDNSTGRRYTINSMVFSLNGSGPVQIGVDPESIVVEGPTPGVWPRRWPIR
jgi:hypothetical protein